MGAINRGLALVVSILLVAGAWAIRQEVAGGTEWVEVGTSTSAVRAAEPASLRGSELERSEQVLVGIEVMPDQQDAEFVPGGGCELRARGIDDGEEPAFDAWRDAVVEDGTLDYIGRTAMRAEAGVWELTQWDGTRVWVGWSVAEDSDVWSTARCAAAAIEAEAGGR